MSPAPLAYRRSSGLVCYWRNGQLIGFVPSAARHVALTPEALSVLDQLESWTTADEFSAATGDASVDAARELFETLADLSLLERRGDRPADDPWGPWQPEAAFFHFATRNVPYSADRAAVRDRLAAKASAEPPPPPTKRMDGGRERIAPTGTLGPLEATLTRRRTWRQFSPDPVSREALATLLDLTCRVRHWGDGREQGRIALKTSPSAGARHPIEAYVIAWNVDSLRPGVYHYDAADGALVDLGRAVTGDRVAAMLAHQSFYAAAAAVVVFTAVFEREVWKYPFARAYRAVLIDAGHLGQTFCLVATELGLAPFCTMAFFETPLEELLGIDGYCESVMYVVGVGARPPGVTQPSLIPGGERGD